MATRKPDSGRRTQLSGCGTHGKPLATRRAEGTTQARDPGGRPQYCWAGLARRVTGAQWRAVETGLAAVTERMMGLLPAPRKAALTEGPVTIDLDATHVEVYGRKKRGVAYNYQGQCAGRPHVAAWAETEIVLAADLGTGIDDPRGTSPARWPAPPTMSRSASRSAPRASPRCGGCWMASATTPGPMRSRWRMRRSPRRRTARTGSRHDTAADPPGPAGPRPGLG